MKKVLTILLVLVAFTSQAQYKTKLGILGRVNISTFRSGNTLRTNEITVNPEVGVNFTIPASPNVAVVIEGAYVQTGGRFGTFDGRPRVYDLRLRYAKLPITLALGKGDFKLKVGWYEAYLLDKVTIGSFYNNNYSFYSSHWIANRSDRGAILGFEIILNDNLVWTNQGSYSVRRTGNDPNDVLWQERLVSIGTGLKYNF